MMSKDDVRMKVIDNKIAQKARFQCYETSGCVTSSQNIDAVSTVDRGTFHEKQMSFRW